MRTHDANASDFAGEAFVTVQYIAVNPLFLLHPAYLIIGITLVLVGTILRARESTIPVWKFSPLPILRSQDPDHAHQSMLEVREHAEQTLVQLCSEGEKYHLRARSC